MTSQEPQQPGQYGPYGMPAPQGRSRKVLWIVLGIVGGLVILAIVGVLALVNLIGGATNKARSLADDFTNLLITGQTDKAYDQYLDPALMQQMDREDFANGVRSLELDESCHPNYSSLNVSSHNGTNAADVAGKLECTGKTIDLAYRFEGKDDLKMVSMRLRPGG